MARVLGGFLAAACVAAAAFAAPSLAGQPQMGDEVEVVLVHDTHFHGAFARPDGVTLAHYDGVIGEILDTNIQFNELSENKKSLSAEETRLNRKIEGRCCACIQTKSLKADLADLSKIQADLRAVTDNIERLGKAKKENSVETEATYQAEIKKLKSELEAARNQLKEHDEHSSDQIRAAQKHVTEAEIRLAREKNEIERLKLHYYASLSEPAIRKMVNVYALFLDFQREAESYFIQPDKGDKDKFLKTLKVTRDRFDESIALVWCRELENKTGFMLYQELLNANQTTPIKKSR